MKRTTLVLNAAAVLGVFPAISLAGGAAPGSAGTELAPNATSLTDAPRAMRPAKTRGVQTAGGVLYDNGDTDGANGYSNATINAFGARRTLLDDFTVPDGQIWTINGLEHQHIWNTLPVGSGVGMEVALWSDASGQPDMLTQTLTVTGYNEVAGPGTFFDRPEAIGFTDFDAVELLPGTYWFEATVIGPENNFWLIHNPPLSGAECWVNYEDLGGLQPGSLAFGGATADLSYKLMGSSVSGGPSTAFGLLHQPNGQAELTAGPGTLTVSNIGSSGKDGVSIDLGETGQGWLGTGELQGDLPEGASMVLGNRGTRGGVADQLMGGTVITGLAGGDMQMNVDLSQLDATTYTLTLYLDGEVVFSQSDIPDTIDFITIPAGTNAASCFCKLLPSPVNILWYMATSAPIDVQLLAGTFSADRLEIIPDGEQADLESIQFIDLTMTDTADLVINDEALHKFDLDHRVLGTARFTAGSDGLVVSNIGSSGEDGVTVDLPPAGSYDATTLPFGTPVNGNLFSIEALGSTSGPASGGGDSLGIAGQRNLGGLVGVFADYGAIGSDNVRIEVYDDGALVDTATVAGNPLRIAIILPEVAGDPQPGITGAGKIAIDPGPPCYYIAYEANVEVRPNGGGSIVGDEIRMLADDADVTITSLGQVDLLGNGVGTMTITEEAFTGTDPPKEGCEGDANGDDVVDTADLVILLAEWGDCVGCDADFNGDDVVDTADLVILLAAWGPCP
jgi:hypothetical protein